MLASSEAFHHAGSRVAVIDMPAPDSWWPNSVWAVLSTQNSAVRMERLDVLGQYHRTSPDGSQIRTEWLYVDADQIIGGQELVCAPERWYAVGRTALRSSLDHAIVAPATESLQVIRLIEQKYERIPTVRLNPAIGELQRQARQLNLTAAGRRQGILRWLRSGN